MLSMQYFLALTTAYSASLIGTPKELLFNDFTKQSGGFRTPRLRRRFSSIDPVCQGLAQILFDLAKQTNMILLTPRVEKLNP